MKKIDYRFKLMYFFGIIFIVAGHCGNGGISILYDWFPPYSFHLGLFVFCSGYFYKEKCEKNVNKYIVSKIKKLLIPLYIWNLVYFIIICLLEPVGFTIGTGGNILDKLLIKPITSGHQFGYNLGGWFVIPLLMIEIFNILFRKITSFMNKIKIKELIYFVFYLVLGVIGIKLSKDGFNHDLWLVLVRMLYLLPFYGLGIFYKKVLEKYDRLSNITYFSIIMVISLIIILKYGVIPSYTPSWCNDFYHISIMPFIVGFLGIALWFRICTILQSVLGKNKYINIVADNTYSIMLHHFMGFMIVKTIFNLFASDFNFGQYKSNLWYMYLPNGINQFKIIYLISGIVFPILIKKMIDKVFKLLKKCK